MVAAYGSVVWARSAWQSAIVDATNALCTREVTVAHPSVIAEGIICFRTLVLALAAAPIRPALTLVAVWHALAGTVHAAARVREFVADVARTAAAVVTAGSAVASRLAITVSITTDNLRRLIVYARSSEQIFPWADLAARAGTEARLTQVAVHRLPGGAACESALRIDPRVAKDPRFALIAIERVKRDAAAIDLSPPAAILPFDALGDAGAEQAAKEAVAFRRRCATKLELALAANQRQTGLLLRRRYRPSITAAAICLKAARIDGRRRGEARHLK